MEEKIFTKEIKNLVTNLLYIYNIDILTMQGIIKTSLTEKGTIDKEILRKSCRNYYQFENNNKLPTLINTKQPEHLKTPTGDVSKRAQMIYTFENTTPYQFIKSKYKDGKVINRDLNLIESLLLDLKLAPGVVNVLLDYVLRINKQKLNKNYVETIASSWKRLGFETVDEAMKACIKEHKKLLKTKEIKTKPKDNGTIPEWFDQKIEKKEIKTNEELEIKELLKKYQ